MRHFLEETLMSLPGYVKKKFFFISLTKIFKFSIKTLNNVAIIGYNISNFSYIQLKKLQSLSQLISFNQLNFLRVHPIASFHSLVSIIMIKSIFPFDAHVNKVNMRIKTEAFESKVKKQVNEIFSPTCKKIAFFSLNRFLESSKDSFA